MVETVTRPDGRRRHAGIPLEETDLDGWAAELLNRHPAVGFAIGVVRDGQLAFFAAHGATDVERATRITPDTVFRIASITKTMTAIAVMQLVEEGRVDLDAPANDYLRAYQLIPARGSTRPATVRHLLTHTAGIPEVLRATDLLRPDWGDSLPLHAAVPTLAELYQGGIHLHGEPGTTFTYTNHGFATLQQIVEDVSDRPFDVYLRERIFAPLGMTDTDLLRTDRLTERLATGYEPTRLGPRPVTERAWTTPGASSVYSTTADMARYAAALMGGGANEHGRVLEPDTMAAMFAPHFRGDPRVPGMGLGFDRGDAGGHLVIGHGGILPGFNSQLFVAPDDQVATIAWTTGGHRAMLWLPTETGRLLHRLMGLPVDAVRTDIAPRVETWSELCGHYAQSGGVTDIRARLMTGFGADVFVRGDRLMLRLLTPVPGLIRGLQLHPDSETDADVFRVDLGQFGLPTARVVFSREPGIGVAAMHLDIFPMSLRKRPRVAGRRRLGWAVAASVGLSMAGTLLARRRSATPSS